MNTPKKPDIDELIKMAKLINEVEFPKIHALMADILNKAKS